MELIAISVDTSFTTLVKGKGHKYVKRELKDAGPPKKYRYWYKMPRAGMVTSSSLHVGAKFQHGTGDNAGHYEITGGPTVLGRYAVKHDETGEVKQMTVDELKTFIHRHHDNRSLLAGLEKRKKAFLAAWKHGTDKQVKAREKDLLDFARGYWGQTTNSDRYIAVVKRDNPRRITPIGSRQRRTAEDIRRAKEQQDQILQRVVDAYKIEDRTAIKNAREEWTTHRARYGNLSTGYRQKVTAAREEAQRTRAARREQARKIKARNAAQEKSRKAYAKHKSKWAREGMPRPKNSVGMQVREMNTPAWKNHYQNHIATFGGASVASDSTSNRYSFTVRDENGRQITQGFSRTIEQETPSGFATAKPGVPVVDLHNSYLKISDSMRGGDWNAMKLYARQEDWLKEATRNLGADEKSNVVVTIYADINVGKYYWATQGFRYRGNSDRTSHLNSMLRTLDRLIAGDSMARTKGGHQKSMTDLGWSMDKLRTYRDYLQGEVTKANSGIPNDQKVEPWELFDNDPNGPPVYVKNSDWVQGNDPSKRYIKCTLSKFLMLQAPSWNAVKHVHGVTDRDKQSIAAGDRRRGAAAMAAAKAGKPWDWLGDNVNEKLAAIQKSLFGFVTRVLNPTVVEEADAIRFTLSKSKPLQKEPENYDDGIREDDLPSYEDEVALAEIAEADNGVLMMDDVIALFDEILSTPDEPKGEEKE